MILFAPSYCAAQANRVVDSRWRLYDPTHAIVPVKDLIQIAAIRLTVEEKREEARDLAISRAKEIAQLRSGLSSLQAENKNLTGQNEMLQDELAYVEEDRDKALKKVSGLKPWAVVGKITVFGGVAALGYLWYQEVR